MDGEGYGFQALSTNPSPFRAARYLGFVDDATLLRKSELFQAFGPDDMARLAGEVGHRALRRGDVVFTEGDVARQMFVVRSGRVAISKQSSEGKESIVALMEAGDLFGEMSLFDHEPRSAGARALEPTELLVLPYAPLTQVFDERPTLLWPMVTLLCRRMRVTDAALADSLFLDVTGRTAKRLLELAGGRDEFALPITQEELAAMVGASRERVNKSLAQFTRLGWLAINDRRYRILKRGDLERRAL
jgi:CRP/FNR family cyclic AMP-dependent transcriptional regulator